MANQSSDSHDPTDFMFAVAILAAGKGTRLKSRHPKVLHEIGGKPLLAHVVAAARRVVAPQNIFAIIGHEADRVEEALRSTGINFVRQTEQLGTGHAMMQARSALKSFAHVLVLSGDVPLIRPETIERVRDFHIEGDAGEKVLAIPAENSNEVLGVNTRMELAELDAKLRARKAHELMAARTTIF